LWFAEKLIKRDYTPQQHNRAENASSGNLHEVPLLILGRTP
jgi:hypothetical protein